MKCEHTTEDTKYTTRRWQYEEGKYTLSVTKRSGEKPSFSLRGEYAGNGLNMLFEDLEPLIAFLLEVRDDQTQLEKAAT